MQTKIYVSAEAGVVVCKVYEILDKWTDNKGKVHLETRFLTSAKVTCKDGDVFDEKKGRQLAYYRAMTKAADKCVKKDEKEIAKMQKWINECKERISYNKGVSQEYQDKYAELAE